MPTPVFWRRAFTSLAVIAMILFPLNNIRYMLYTADAAKRLFSLGSLFCGSRSFFCLFDDVLDGLIFR